MPFLTPLLGGGLPTKMDYLQDALIHKSLLELSWQISTREMEESKLRPSSGKLRSSCGFVFSRALHQASRQPQKVLELDLSSKIRSNAKNCLEHFFVYQRVLQVEKKGYPYSNLSTGGPRRIQEDDHFLASRFWKDVSCWSQTCLVLQGTFQVIFLGKPAPDPLSLGLHNSGRFFKMPARFLPWQGVVPFAPCPLGFPEG